MCVSIFHRTALMAFFHLITELCMCPSPVFLPACCLEPFRDVSLPLSFLSLLLCEWSSTICLKYNIENGFYNNVRKYTWTQRLTLLGRLNTFVRNDRLGFRFFFFIKNTTLLIILWKTTAESNTYELYLWSMWCYEKKHLIQYMVMANMTINSCYLWVI